MRRVVVAGLLSATLLGACGASAPFAGEGAVEVVLDNPAINESSGLARSQRRDDLLWTLNDSGGATAVYGITTDGRHVVTLRLVGMPFNLDWEDLASYSHEGEPWLLIGDIGDNGAIRPFVQLFRVPEPEVTWTSEGDVEQINLRATSVIAAVYPDGPRDAESLAVDADSHTAYILSKRDPQPRLYALPLDRRLPLAVMTDLGPVNLPRAAADFEGDANRFNWITAMDFDDRQRHVLATSLLHAYRWTRAEGQSWAEAMAAPPAVFTLPDYPQIEAATFARGTAAAFYLTSEQLPAPLARLPMIVPGAAP